MSRAEERPHRIVVELELSNKAGNALYRLMNRDDCVPSLSATLEEALLLQDALQGIVDQGSQLVCQSPDGGETVVDVGVRSRDQRRLN